MDLSDADIHLIAANAILGAARESGMNQQQLAKAAGMSSVTVQKVLSGNQGIKVAQFIRLTEVTELTPTDVMDRVIAAVNRRSASDRPTSIADHRAAKKPADMTEEEMEGLSSAANTDPEFGYDEPDSP